MDNAGPAGAELMRAAVLRSFGPPESLRVEQVERPQPAPGEVLVEVVAAGVNPVDASNRADGSWAGLTPPLVLGSDAAGVVVACGEGVSGPAPGDAVYYFTDFLGTRLGSYAEYQSVPASIVAPKPSRLTFAEAAAVPLAAGTAYEAIVRRLALANGETVLIYGAAGSVGAYAVQLAAAAGARVIAVARSVHAERLAALGAADTLDYRQGSVEDAVAARYGSVEAVADFVGGETLSRALPVVAEAGRVATACGLAGDLELAIDRNITIHGILVRPDGDRLVTLAGLFEAGRLRPHVRRELALEEVAEAHAEIEQAHGRGKLVLRMRPEPARG